MTASTSAPSAWCYILASEPHGAIFTGSTTDLAERLRAHRAGTVAGMTAHHTALSLVWMEAHPMLSHAEARELIIKRWRRAWKISLIEEANPTWADLSDKVGG